MKHYKKIIFALVAISITLVLFFMRHEREEEHFEPRVAVSSFALYDIVKHIAQESVEIVNILPFGVDIHSFEPTPKLVASLEKSALILYSGAGLEPWMDHFVFKVRAVDVSEHVNLRELDSDVLEEHEIHEEHEDAHEEDENHHAHCAHEKIDPHYWLDVENMAKATVLITDELIKIAPQNEEIYLKNKENYLVMLKNLDAKYAKALKECRNDTIVVNHSAYDYLSHRYGFHVEALSGFSPDAQPSPKSMAKLIKLIEEKNIKTIFFENFSNDKAIKSISKDTHIEVDSLHPLANITADEAKESATYEDIMKKNLEKIAKALMCK